MIEIELNILLNAIGFYETLSIFATTTCATWPFPTWYNNMSMVQFTHSPNLGCQFVISQKSDFLIVGTN